MAALWRMPSISATYTREGSTDYQDLTLSHMHGRVIACLLAKWPYHHVPVEYNRAIELK